MLSYINGKIAEILENGLVVEANGLGYHILAGSRTLSALKTNQEVKIYTQMLIKENDISIVGFLSRDEIDMFNLLVSVSGVGAKAALNVLSALDSHKIMLGILTDSPDEFTKVAGIGKKTAARIILELKDKLKSKDIFETTGINPQQNITYGNSQARNDATEALISLGYSKSESLRAIMEIELDNIDSGQIIKLALKKLNKG